MNQLSEWKPSNWLQTSSYSLWNKFMSFHQVIIWVGITHIQLCSSMFYNIFTVFSESISYYTGDIHITLAYCKLSKHIMTNKWLDKPHDSIWWPNIFLTFGVFGQVSWENIFGEHAKLTQQLGMHSFPTITVSICKPLKQ